MSLQREIAAVLRGWRAQRGWSQSEVPGVAQGTVSRWESGSGLSIDALEEMLTVYDRSFLELAVEVERLFRRGPGLTALFAAIAAGAQLAAPGEGGTDETQKAGGEE